MKNKLNYIIFANSYNPDSGGIVVLHKLCDILNKLGENAFMLPLRGYRRHAMGLEITNEDICEKKYKTNPLYKTPLLSKDIDFTAKENVFIYPEGVQGNPIAGTKNIVRYILYHVNEKTSKTWKNSDLKFLHSSQFETDLVKCEKDVFSIWETQKDFFKDLGKKRKGSCFLVKKGEKNREQMLLSGEAERYEKPGALRLSGRFKEFLHAFNTHEIFYSYDCATYISTIAALCGCQSVIIPNPSLGKNHRSKNINIPYLKYGTAYGLEDLDRANKTRRKLRPYLEELEKENITNAEKFIKITYDRFMV